MAKWIAVATAAAALVIGALLLTRSLLPVPVDRLPGPGGYRFWSGINYPWKSYQDFGTGLWGHSGVSSPDVYGEIDTDFANMETIGTQVVKWRVFNDARYSPEFDEDGSVLGYDEMFLKDVDAALEIASRHHLYLVLSLFDSGLWTTGCERDGVQMGGHADLITDPGKRSSLIERAIVPLAQHVARSGRVVAFELLAEPEWGIAELHTEQDGRQTVPLYDVQSLVREAAAAIHEHGGQLVTVESNRASNMQHWKGLGLDYYSFSWYDWVQPYDPLDLPAESYGLDRPVVLGEYPVEGSAHYDYRQVLDIAFGQGYAGAFAWSYDASDRYGTLRDVRDGYAEWLASHWKAVDLSRGAMKPPQAPVALLPPPVSYQNVQVGLDGEGVAVDVGLSVREGGAFHVQFYLYPFGDKPTKPTAERSLVLQSGGQGTLHLRLPDVPEGRLYRLSMAVFDDAWGLRKWFDSIALFSLSGGKIAHPALSDLEKEDPCAKPRSQ